MVRTIKVLDHGSITLHNICGMVPRRENEFDAHSRDCAMVARTSFDQMHEGRGVEQDMQLTQYLLKNKHTTPIEFIEVWVEMKLPIFVARQFVRHRTVSINEVSGRYVQLPAEWYIPEIVGGVSTNGAKQGQENYLTQETQEVFKNALNAHCSAGYLCYELALHHGVAPEHARLLLSVNHYTHWAWKQDLHNMLHFLRLRMHPHAQVEARAYANALHQLLHQVLPEFMTLWDSLEGK